MKKALKVMFAGILTSLMLVGSGWAMTYNFSDTTVNWPGWTPQYTKDVIGIPSVTGGYAVISASGNLETVVFLYPNKDRDSSVDMWLGPNVPGTETYDTLFINSGGPYQAWDYYVEDTTADNATGATLYAVGNLYTYKLATDPWGFGTGGRWGHPAGIADGIADRSNLLASVIWDEQAGILTYSFNQGILMGPGWQIGYSQWCANDVVLTPEPLSLLLLGLGLIGVAGMRRKF